MSNGAGNIILSLIHLGALWCILFRSRMMTSIEWWTLIDHSLDIMTLGFRKHLGIIWETEAELFCTLDCCWICWGFLWTKKLWLESCVSETCWWACQVFGCHSEDMDQTTLLMSTRLGSLPAVKTITPSCPASKASAFTQLVIFTTTYPFIGSISTQKTQSTSGKFATTSSTR